MNAGFDSGRAYPELIRLVRTEFEVIRPIADDALAVGDVIFIEE